MRLSFPIKSFSILFFLNYQIIYLLSNQPSPDHLDYTFKTLIMVDHNMFCLNFKGKKNWTIERSHILNKSLGAT